MTRLLACSLLIVMSGCFSSRFTDRSARLDPLPKDCTITWEHGDLNRLLELVTQKGYVQVAYASVTPQRREFTPKLKKYLRPRVCKRGGDYVIMTQSVGQGANGTMGFEILSSKGDQARASQPGPVTD